MTILFHGQNSKAKAGDTAEVLGPYGRFSYALHPHEDDLVMIAGGIGVTPLMSMIRHLHDVGSENRVLLLYANRTERDMVFRQELDEIARSEHPRLTLVHVLSRPDDSWTGPRGHIDRQLIAEHCSPSSDKVFYVGRQGRSQCELPLGHSQPAPRPTFGRCPSLESC